MLIRIVYEVVEFFGTLDVHELVRRVSDRSGRLPPGAEDIGERRRTVAVDAAKHPAKARMAEKLATSAGRAHYAQRKWLSEAPNGWIKEVLGFRRFSLRGLKKVQGEWDLVCLALNVKRMQGLQAAR